jgi:carbamoyl-phosphate synthase large subunit
VGECNIQFALSPKTGEYRVIEVNARLSRSSALASKATGYPLAHVAAKIALGHTLPEIPNSITRVTTAFFEPALDYIVCKIPRWDLQKFDGADDSIGTEMKSVGEVMAIGRTFGEAVQKALRMLEIGVDGLDPHAFEPENLESALSNPTPRRILAVACALAEGWSVERVNALTSIDPFFLNQLADVVNARRSLGALGSLSALDAGRLLALKRAGFSDRAIARELGATEDEVRELRWKWKLRPRVSQIDTLAAEYPAQTNYLYLTYGAIESDVVPPASARLVLVLGSGVYRIGSSVEFDWCCVGAAKAARELGHQVMVLNCNPETVSTDYDVCDWLVFDELTLESVLELCAYARPQGVFVSTGGQAPNNLALDLHRAGVPIVGTPADSIDLAEDRRKFSALCDELGIDQPRWTELTDPSRLDQAVTELGGYPVLVRPSYVLSGAAMRVAHNAVELRQFLTRAVAISPRHPVVISKFVQHARELEFDAVAEHGEIVEYAICEHLENAGVHSGDATLVLPPQGVYLETIRRVRRIGRLLAKRLDVTGPFNLQLIAQYNRVKVIECNLRASRSFPFVSKVLGSNFIRNATRVMLGAPSERGESDPLDLDWVAVKSPMFSYRRLAGADPIQGVEMSSTGEVATFGEEFDEALLKSLLATGFRIPKKGVLLSLGPTGEKYRFSEECRMLAKKGLRIYATAGTAAILAEQGIAAEVVDKGDSSAEKVASALEWMRSGHIDLVINIPREHDERGRPDGFALRRAASELEIPLITDLPLARYITRALARYDIDALSTKAAHEYRPAATAEEAHSERWSIGATLPPPRGD